MEPTYFDHLEKATGEVIPFMPSNGIEMMDFYEHFCDLCQNQAELDWTERNEPPGCPHIVDATAKNKQPIPWVIKDGKPFCLEFQGADNETT